MKCCLTGRLFLEGEFPRHFLQIDINGECRYPIYRGVYTKLLDESSRPNAESEDAVIVYSSVLSDGVCMVVSAEFIIKHWPESAKLIEYLQDYRIEVMRIEACLRRRFLDEVVERTSLHTRDPNGPWSSISE